MIKALTRAREQTYLLHLELYCEVEDCPARDVTVFIKDHDDTLIGLVRARGLTCPVCGSAKVTLRRVQTPAEYDAEEEREARGSVIRQMHRRDYAKGGWHVMDFHVFMREDLPPTPPGWWDTK